MRRLVTLLLIPMFMLGHALSHSHAGTGVDSPRDHAVRPHLHLSSSDHAHEHGHDHHDDAEHAHSHHVQHETSAEDGSLATSEDAVISGVQDHDSDAIYFANSPATPGRSVCDVQNITAQDYLIGEEFIADLNASHPPLRHPPQRYTTLPIFLLTASLRL
ncbi:hypothetical protein [Aporhodopirellula aestuarii]|uniref:Secreted protein n=1 Tax=Aporhodopirellula aestuarii TaxID=2950107 RepID=A0ABT0U5W3_9BACT|nr:hypothetical protein [Aporhodopirellula aestuarii]MCM2372270.1 hypothetical protein [Aporhodopirellula aestuarii]